MFNESFFPTPNNVIKKMIDPFYSVLSDLSILEPSAGKGNILDYVKTKINSQRNHYKDTNVPDNLYACEIEPELKMILQEKGYKVIGDDFLSYSGTCYFDLILMNPPFNNGDKHLLKAWETLKEGDIVCLLNSETINNPFSESRKLLAKIIKDNNGIIENIGSVFNDAERTTGVQVSIVRLKKKAKESELDFKFESVTKDKNKFGELDENVLKDGVATRDIVGNMMLQYERLREGFVDYMKAIEKIDYYKQSLFSQYFNLETVIEESIKKGKTNNQKFNLFCDETKQGIWNEVLSKLNVQKFMTKAVRDNFQKWGKNQGYMDFTKENVASLVNMLFENSGMIMEKAVIDVFDLFTTYHKENRCYQEGWKTNDKWKVNKKVILPRFISMGYGGYYETYHHYNEFDDIDKVMCYLTGKNYDHFNELEEGKSYEYNARDREKDYKMISLKNAVGRSRIGDTGKTESEFFHLRCYKKGTVHIEFKDKFLWQEFNMRACSGKNWLPEAEQKEWKEKLKKL